VGRSLMFGVNAVVHMAADSDGNREAGSTGDVARDPALSPAHETPSSAKKSEPGTNEKL